MRDTGPSHGSRRNGTFVALPDQKCALKSALYRMQRVRFPGFAFGLLLAFTAMARADVVTEPLRKFGLGDLLQVAISPDGAWMATAGSSGAFLWDFKSGTVVQRLESHHARVPALCFSPDSRVLLTGGFDRTIRAWAVESGLELRSFTGHLGGVMDLAFAPDGQSFVSVGDNSARIWSLDTGELLRHFTVSGASIVRAVFAPDGRRLVTADGSLNDNVRLWDLRTGEMIRRFGHLVQTLGFVAGGHLVTGNSDLATQLWDVDTGEVIRPLPGATHLIVGLLTSTNDSMVTAGCHNGRVMTWDAATGDIVHDFMGESLVSLAAIPGTNQILTAHPNNLVRARERELGTNLRHFAGHTTSTTTGVGFSRDGRYVVSGGTEVFTRVWNRTNAELVNLLPGHGAGTEAATFSPDGTQILTTFGGPIHSARLWNAATGLLEREFFGHTKWPLTAVFSPDGRRIATGAQDGTARLWDIATGAQIRSFPSPGGAEVWIRAVAVSSNGMLLASGGSDGTAHLWNAATGQWLRSFEMNAGSVKSLEFSPATGDLLVAWEDGFLRTFEPATGELKLDSITPAAFLETAVFSPDGRFILGGEGWPFFTARLWDARNGQELRVFAGHAAPVDSVAFNATGTSILTGSDIVRLWSIADIAARLDSELKPNGLELRWHTGALQSSAQANGPWNDVPNAISPTLVPTGQSSEFFRVRLAGPEEPVER